MSEGGTGCHLPFPASCSVEAPGVEPGSEDRPHNGSTCVADRFRFTATAQATAPVKEMSY
jgi:hypothetical protein